MSGEIKRFKRKTLMLKPETVYGTDASPAAVNAILATDVEVSMEYDTSEKPEIRNELGGREKRLFNIHGKCSFTVELSGAGTAGNVPAYGPCERATGLLQDETDPTKVSYLLASEGHEAASIYAYFDDAWFIFTGSRGTSTETWGNSYPTIRYEMTGLWNPVADTTWVTGIDWSGWKEPVEISGTNTDKITVGAHQFCAASLSFVVGNDVKFRDHMGCKSVVIMDRDVTGEILMPAAQVDLTVWNPWVIAEAGTLQAFSMTHGTVAGHILERTAPKMQIFPPSRVNEDGEVMWRIPVEFKPDAGDDELTKVVR